MIYHGVLSRVTLFRSNTTDFEYTELDFSILDSYENIANFSFYYCYHKKLNCLTIINVKL